MKNANNENAKDLVPLGNLGNVSAYWRNKSTEGSCNFCRRNNYYKVLVVQGNSLNVRFCKDCLDSIKKQS